MISLVCLGLALALVLTFRLVGVHLGARTPQGTRLYGLSFGLSFLGLVRVVPTAEAPGLTR